MHLLARLLPLTFLAACCSTAQEPSPALAVLAEARAERAAAQDPAPAFDHTHAAWTALLKKHVHGANFDYGAVKKDRAALDAYAASLALVTPEQLATFTKDQRFAFWINAYNAFTIQKVVDEYPLKSIRDLDKFFGASSVFDREFIPMRALHPEEKDDDLSLNDIEHGILRTRFEDARLHAAVNCASASCPPLLAEAFVASKLDAQLDGVMRAFVNDPVRNEFRPEKKEVGLSKIFEWFAADFERDAGSVRAYLLRFASDERKPLLETAKLKHVEYDWSLNDHRSEGSAD